MIPAKSWESGLSQSRLDKIRPFFEQHIAANRMAGGLGFIARRGKTAYLETFGMADKEAGKPMREDTIFRIYSMTKAVTGVAAMILFEEGRFALADPLSNFIPEFRSMHVAVEKNDPATGKPVLDHTVPAQRQIAILDLMRHTAGFNYYGPHDESGELSYRKLGLEMGGGGNFTLEEMVKRLSQAPLVNEPGTVWDYGFGTDVLGRFVEVVSGQALDVFFEERIFKPLRMDETGFFVSEQNRDRLAAMYLPGPEGIRRATGPIQDGFFTRPVLLLGGAGLTSTVTDYSHFTEMLLNGGERAGERLLSPRTVDLMRSDMLGNLPVVGPLLPAGHGFGLTFAVCRGRGPSASLASKGQYRWGGAAGTAFWIDPRENMIGIFMMQTLLDLAKRAQFQQLAYQAIVD